MSHFHIKLNRYQLESVQWECYQRDEPVTSGMEIIKWAEGNPDDETFMCVPVDRNIGMPKSELVKCKCAIWSDIDAINFLTGDTRYIWAKDCNDIKHCDCTEVEEYTLTLKQYPPYYKPGKGDIGRSGDLVATLKDKDGKGVSDKTVFFYVAAGTNLKGILENSFHPTKWAGIRHNFPDVSYVGYDYTSKGVAKWNYIDHNCIRPDALSKRIRDTGKNVKGPIVAVVYDEKTDEIGQRASVNIELSGVAKITKISAYSIDKNNKMMIQASKDEERKVRVMRVEKGTIPVYDKHYIPQSGLTKIAKCTPYNLLYGDIILLDENDFIDVLWLTGTKMKIVTKTGFLKEDEYAKFHIGGFGSWSLYQFLDQQTKSPLVHLGNTLRGGVIAIWNPVAAVGSIIASEVFAISWWVSDAYCNPLFIVPYSTILIDFDETATVYTVEGTGRLYNKDKSTTDVTTGHKMSVSPDGTFSSVSKFDRSELSEELSYVLDEIEGKPHKPRPTSTPVYTSTATPKPTPVRRSTSTESTPAQEPTTQEECERWCSSRYGAGTPGMFYNIDGCVCRCKDGYGLNAEGRKVRITIEECDQLCLDKFGIGGVGVFNSDEMCRCVCREGYEFNEEEAKYIKIRSTQTVKPTTQEECERWCSSKYGAGVPGIFFNNICACRCKEGYTEDGVKITLEQCDQRCFDKFGTGHRGAFNPDEICKCVCEEGYTLNEAKTRCVKISPTKRPQTPAPTYSYDDDYTYDDSVPGFEAIYAIAGLLSVAYLVLRKRK